MVVVRAAASGGRPMAAKRGRASRAMAGRPDHWDVSRSVPTARTATSFTPALKARPAGVHREAMHPQPLQPPQPLRPLPLRASALVIARMMVARAGGG